MLRVQERATWRHHPENQVEGLRAEKIIRELHRLFKMSFSGWNAASRRPVDLVDTPLLAEHEECEQVVEKAVGPEGGFRAR